MTDSLSHRGPDGEGFLIRGPLALGNRRLAIIDLRTGGQPMSNEDGSIWVTYNGEIYNYVELTRELQSRGHRFTTQSDTEVIVHAYEQWGPNCVQHFRGMFAFGLADFGTRRLLLARDHFGIKPLYYRTGRRFLAFGSELSALRQVECDSPKGDLQSLDFYLRFQYVPTPRTIYHDVFKLPPASYLEVRFDGTLSGPTRYWDFRYQPEVRASVEEQIDAVIQEAVSAHLVSDVPFGLLLSGGVDSTMVALQMSRLLQRPLKAFTIDFSERSYSELAYAKEAARRCGLELYSEIIDDSILQVMPGLVAHYGEPFGDSSMIPTWCVSRLARTQVPMVLSGDGGDEAFGGYDTYIQWMRLGQFSKPSTRLDVRQSQGFFSRCASVLRQRVKALSRTDLADWQSCILYMNDASRRALWQAQYHYLLDRPCELFREADLKARHWDRLAYAQYLDYQTYLPCAILTKVDVASMYHGLEVRPPLLDTRVVEFAATLTLPQRFRKDRGLDMAKYALKRALQRSFPPEFVYRRKHGFAPPRAEWFLPGRPARDLLQMFLRDPDPRFREWFTLGFAFDLLDRHSPDRDTSAGLWLLLVLAIWLDQNPGIDFA